MLLYSKVSVFREHPEDWDGVLPVGSFGNSDGYYLEEILEFELSEDGTITGRLVSEVKDDTGDDDTDDGDGDDDLEVPEP